MNRTIRINVPPDNHCCEVCGRKADLHKTFRDFGVIVASWECESCLSLSDSECLIVTKSRELEVF